MITQSNNVALYSLSLSTDMSHNNILQLLCELFVVPASSTHIDSIFKFTHVQIVLEPLELMPKKGVHKDDICNDVLHPIGVYPHRRSILNSPIWMCRHMCFASSGMWFYCNLWNMLFLYNILLLRFLNSNSYWSNIQGKNLKLIQRIVKHLVNE